jgi:NAD+ diphosphatase
MTPDSTSKTEPSESGWWFIFSGNKLLVQSNEERFSVPFFEDRALLKFEIIRKQFVGRLDGHPCYSAESGPHARTPDGMSFVGLRPLFGHLDDRVFRLAGRAFQIMNWDRTHQFCSQCGHPTRDKGDETAKLCPACGFVSFPVMSPAIIVAVTRGDNILLARAGRFPSEMYSVLAGFVEPGESLEECVRREVGEEVGVEVTNICYFGSQPWPFPNSLMIGFTAEYQGGEIRIDEKEIVDAGWFKADSLPKIPDKISIARRLIDWFVDRHTAYGARRRV